MHTGSDVSAQRYWAPQLWTTSSYAWSDEQDGYLQWRFWPTSHAHTMVMRMGHVAIWTELIHVL